MPSLQAVKVAVSKAMIVRNIWNVFIFYCLIS
jgi:hypothetical protein